MCRRLRLSRSSPCSGYSDGPRHAFREMLQQALPVLQVGGRRRHRDQLAVAVADHRLAVHVADIAAKAQGGFVGRLLLPAPVADVEGHRQVQLLAFGEAEEAFQHLDPAALGRLVVLHQQLQAVARQAPAEGGEIGLFRQKAERDLEPSGSASFGAAQGRLQLGVQLAVFAPQLEG